MRRGRYRIFLLLLLPAALLAFSLLCPYLRRREEKFRIACGEDLASRLFMELIEEQRDVDAVADPTVFGDCCGSYAMMSLVTGELDAALLCEDAAEKLRSLREDYVELGVISRDTDVLALAEAGREIRRIGYMNQRDTQRRSLEAAYPSAELFPMSPSALPTALFGGEIDAAVLDLGTALSLSLPLRKLGDGTVSAVLVAREDCLKKEAFQKLLSDYEKKLPELSNEKEITGLLSHYMREDEITEEKREQWKAMGPSFESLREGREGSGG